MKLYMFRTVPLSIISSLFTVHCPKHVRVSCQNKFVKLVHLVGFIIKKNGHFLLLLQSVHHL